MKNIFLLAFLSGILLSCMAEDNSLGVDLYPIFNESIVQNEWFVVDHYTPLCTAENSEYLFELDKIRVWGDAIFILQEYNNKRTVFKFDNKGNILKTLNGSEHDNKRFYDVNDINVRDGVVVINSRVNREVLYFDHDLNYLNSYLCPFEEGIQNMFLCSTGELIVRPASDPYANNSLFLIDTSDVRFPKPINGSEDFAKGLVLQMNLMSYESFSTFNDSDLTLYSEIYDSGIKEVSPKGLAEKYNVNMSDDVWISDEEIEELKKMDEFEGHNFRAKINKGYFFDQFFEGESKLIVSFMRKLKRYFVVYDKNEDKVRSGVVNFESTRINNFDYAPPLKYLKGFTSEGLLVFKINAEEFKLYAERLETAISNGLEREPKHQHFLDVAQGIDEYCSSVLAFVKLNDLPK